MSVNIEFMRNVTVTDRDGLVFTVMTSRGAPGYTPVKGTDYWTAEDVAEMSGAAAEAVRPVVAAYLPFDTLGPAAAVSTEYGLGGLPMPSVVVDIVPAQSGSGDPSPSNVRDISGYTSVGVTVSPTDDPGDGVTYTAAIPETPGTVYGGTLNMTTGEGVSDMKLAQMTSSWLSGLAAGYIGYNETITALGGKSGVWVRNWNYSEMPGRKSGGIKTICNAFPVHVHDSSINNSQNRIYFEVGDSITSTEDFLAAVQALENNGSGLFIAYELATPITYQCTPQEILALAGTNVLTSGAGQVSATIPIDLKAYVDDKIAEGIRATRSIIAGIETGMTATRAYSAGNLLIVGDTLYKATTSIANGATFTPGTNVTATTVAEQLIALANT